MSKNDEFFYRNTATLRKNSLSFSNRNAATLRKILQVMLQYYGLYLEKKMDLVMSYDSNATLVKKYK